MKCLVCSVPYRLHPAPAEARESTRPAASSPGSSAYTAYELARLRSLLGGAGHDVAVADIAPAGRAKVVELLHRTAPDVVVVDASSFQDHSERHFLLDFFHLVKSILPGARTVWAGRDARALADFALTHSTVVDVVLREESDSVLPGLLALWEVRGLDAPLWDIPGVAFP